MSARFDLHNADGSVRESWIDTPGWAVVDLLRRRARNRRLEHGSQLRSDGRIIATWPQLNDDDSLDAA